jgi:hypothetical protein
LPQHLAYARILEAPDDPLLSRVYSIDMNDGYATVHRALAWLAGLVSLEEACRLVYTAHAVAVPLAFARLARAVHRAEGPVALLGVALVWTPVACMGFLPFMLALAPFMFGVAEATRFARGDGARHAVIVSLATLLLGALHVVAMGILLLFLAIFALVRRGRAIGAFAACVAAAACVLVRPRASTTLDGIDGFAALDMRWTPIVEKLNMIAATVFGPFPHRTRLTVEIGALVVALIVTLAHTRTVVRERTARAYVWSGIAFVAVSLLLPHSVRKPDDLSYLDFRVMVFALAIALAAVPPRWFSRPTPALALATAMTLFVGCWARQLFGDARELEGGVELVSRLRPTDRLLALSFHDRSAYFDESNAMNHYVGVYHTAFTGGVTSLFWGKFARHLPVGYREAPPPRPPDWRPGEFTSDHVRAATHVLVTWPDASDTMRLRRGAEQLRAMTNLREEACRGRYCLYSVEASSQSAAIE